MPFNSYEFLVIFLPLTFVVFVLAQRMAGWRMAYLVLAVASLVFYAQMSVALLGILLVSVVSNNVFGTLLSRAANEKAPANKLLVFSIIANLVALGYFKYTNFFIDISNQLTGAGFSHLQIILPIGISFYTFIQIGYLIDAHAGRVKPQPIVKYTLFATFFPYVTAGPLVMQKEIFDQMTDRDDEALDGRRIGVGLTMFAMGLFKKVILADSIAPFANAAFDGVAGGGVIDPATAWTGTLAYTLQLYFDFSGYSDMALGLGIIFGFKLPLNFNSPFKATSISDFWQRWHITMTRFFTHYVFSPMAMKGMRKAVEKKMPGLQKFVVSGGWPIVFTMLVAGIWHGSGWTFVFYGLLHGFAIAINNAWKQFSMPKISPIAGWALTMAVVTSGLAIFRADNMEVATAFLSAMWGITALTGIGEGTQVGLQATDAWIYIVVLGAICLLAPNTQQMLSRNWISSDTKPELFKGLPAFLTWKPGYAWSAITAALLIAAFTNIGADSSFLYYDF